jgi:hypothetical protein
MGPPRTPLAERFWARVEITESCWLWRGVISKNGYGNISKGGYCGPPLLAHRVAYEFLTGPIPEKRALDHLCRIRHCVNPAHLEPVTNRENILRGEGLAAKNAVATHCKRDHPFTPENTRIEIRKGGRRVRCCRRCDYLKVVKHRLKVKERMSATSGAND